MDSDEAIRISLLNSPAWADIPHEMRNKYADLALYAMMLDAAKERSDFRLVGKDAFRNGDLVKPDELLLNRETLRECDGLPNRL